MKGLHQTHLITEADPHNRKLFENQINTCLKALASTGGILVDIKYDTMNYIRTALIIYKVGPTKKKPRKRKRDGSSFVGHIESCADSLTIFR